MISMEVIRYQASLLDDSSRDVIGWSRQTDDLARSSSIYSEVIVDLRKQLRNEQPVN